MAKSKRFELENADDQAIGFSCGMRTMKKPEFHFDSLRALFVQVQDRSSSG